MRTMKFRYVVVNPMSVKQRGGCIRLHRNLPLAIKLSAHLHLDPLKKLERWRAVKSDIDLAGVRVDPELLHFRFLRKNSRHPRINIVIRPHFQITIISHDSEKQRTSVALRSTNDGQAACKAPSFAPAAKAIAYSVNWSSSLHRECA